MTAMRATEVERRAMEAERRMREMLIELGQRQEKTDARLEEMMQAIMAIKLQNQAKFASEDRFQGIGGATAMAETESSSASLAEEEDPIVQLRNLKQVSHIRSYFEAFDELNSKAGIEEDLALSLFLSGLADELRMPVCMFKPKTLADAYALSKLQEFTMTGVLWCDRDTQSSFVRMEELENDQYEMKLGAAKDSVDSLTVHLKTLPDLRDDSRELAELKEENEVFKTCDLVEVSLFHLVKEDIFFWKGDWKFQELFYAF